MTNKKQHKNFSFLQVIGCIIIFFVWIYTLLYAFSLPESQDYQPITEQQKPLIEHKDITTSISFMHVMY